MNPNQKISVIGGGSWATALVKILCNNVNSINWWMRNEGAVAHILKYRHNPNYLQSVEFDLNKINVSTDLEEIIRPADIVIIATPSAFLVSIFENFPKEILKDKIIFSAVKGIVPESGLIVGEHFFKKYNIPYKNIGVITGPCHAEEVAMERLSYLTIACQDQDQAKKVGECLKSRYIQVKISDDIIGTEYAAMLKNIFSIAAGISHGLGYGDNFQSVLMSNSIREMDRFIKKIHQMKRNINNSAYLGDLLVTGYSTFSRNRMFGNMIGKGYTVKSAMLEMSMVAEGYYATKSAKKIKEENGAITPIIDAVYSVLYKGKDAKRVFEELTKQID